MKKFFKIVGALLLILVIGAGVWIVNVGWYKPYSIDLFYNRVFVRFALQNPELVTSLVPHPLGIRYFDRRLGDVSPATQEQQAAFVKRELETLHSYDRAALNPGQQLSFDILDYFLSTTVEGERWLLYNYPLNPTAGLQSELPSFLAGQHPIDSKADVDSYMARLNLFGRYYDQVLEGLKLRAEKGIKPPKFVVDKTLIQMREFIARKPEENVLYVAFADKIKKLKDMSDAEQKDALIKTATIIQGVVYPAYGRLIENFEALATTVTENNGVWALPAGDEFYAWAVKDQTTSNLKPDEIHAIGLAEVTRIESEMNALLVAEGYAEGSIGARMVALSKEPRFLYPDTPEGRQQCLDDFQKIINEIDTGLAPYFEARPKLGVEVKAVPAFKEANAPGGYYEPGALDGSRPGVFFVNLRKLGEIEKFHMRTLAYHEAIPGHHFQIALAQELKDVPIFRNVLPFNAYAEGWALYSERLAWELGYEKDPFDNLGRLQAELFRAVRLVVDTGMHAKRWSREQALAYLIDKTGMNDTEATAEIERYLVWPGQALGYKLGMLKILELRERAKTQLGDKFDLKEFHKVVLGSGSLPLPVLDEVVTKWLAEKKG
ncbi:DUF885 domain-containing protein [Nevskia ramosa]|uniref:DUF885 domain-containing protein n=1 Tax=Nevskia ramosa TaxID=64002 RepID=UPI0003B7B095|nr:DUF885 domain-containing protein [Nevskia ramosa]